MPPLMNMRKLHVDTEKEECNDDKEIIVSADSDSEDTSEDTFDYNEKTEFYERSPMPPLDSELPGIKSLLKEIFPNAHLDLDRLARLIVSLCYHLILKQVSSEDDDDEDEDDFIDTDINEINDPAVYSISTIVNVNQNVNCMLQLRDHLINLANEHAPDSTKVEIKRILEDDAVERLLLINERDITHFPAEVGISYLSFLYEHVQHSKCERLIIDNTFYIYICKIFKTTKKCKNELNENNILKKEKTLWTNLEEKVMAKQATYSFEFPVNSELVNGLPNKSWIDKPDNWNPNDYDTAVPYRRVLIFEFTKLISIIDKMREKFNHYDSFCANAQV